MTTVTSCEEYQFQNLEEAHSTCSLILYHFIHPTMIDIQPFEELCLIKSIFNIVGMKQGIQRAASHDEVATMKPHIHTARFHVLLNFCFVGLRRGQLNPVVQIGDVLHSTRMRNHT